MIYTRTEAALIDTLLMEMEAQNTEIYKAIKTKADPDTYKKLEADHWNTVTQLNNLLNNPASIKRKNN